MIRSDNLHDTLQEVTSQTLATASALGQIAAEIAACAREERHPAQLSSKLLDAQAKRAALCSTSLAALAGQMAAIARLGAGLVLVALCLAGCSASVETAPPADYCPAGLVPDTDPRDVNASAPWSAYCQAALPGAPIRFCCKPEPTPTCVASSASAVEASPVLAGVCPGVNPIVVQCEKLIVDRADVDSAVGTVPVCTHPAGDAGRELPYVACCYVDSIPSDAGAAL